MKRNLILVFMLVLALTVMAPISAQDDTITIVYWTHNHAPSIPLNEQIIEDFMAENPNIEIIFDNAPHDNFEQRVLTAFAGGEGPDVFWLGDWMMPQFLENNIVAPVDPTAFGVETQEEFEALYAPGSLDAFKDGEGNIFTGGVSEYNTFSLIYNVDHFEAAGIELPSETEPMTWEQLIEIGAQLSETNDDGATTRVGLTWPFQVPIWTVLITEPMVRQLGGELTDPETGAPLLNSPEVVQVMETVRDMQDQGAIDSAFYTDLLQDFATERASSIIGGPWAAQPLKDINPDLNWAVAPLPQFEGAEERATTLYAWAWYVNANSSPEVQEAAWQFVNALTSYQEEWWDTVGYVQGRLGETEDGLSYEEFRVQSDERLQVIFDDYQYGQYQFRSTSYFELSDILTRAMSRILAGEDVQTVLDEAQFDAEFSTR